MQVPGPSIRSHPDVTIKWAGLAIPHITPYPPHPAAPGRTIANDIARSRASPEVAWIKKNVGMLLCTGKGLQFHEALGGGLMWAAAPLHRDVNQGPFMWFLS